MIEAEAFIGEGRRRGFSLYTGVPCSLLKPFINAAIDSGDLRYVGAANEGDAIAIAAGADLAGTRAVVMMQNSGLGNAVNPLTSLAYVFRVPMLVIVTLRGQPGGPADEPQHALMGTITTRQLDLMDIPWEPFPAKAEGIAALFDRIDAHMARTRRPFALVMRKGTVAPRALKSAPPPPRAPGTAPAWAPPPELLASRHDLLTAVQSATRPDDAIIATTGFTGRELYALDDRANQLYMVGSMGCCVSLALGLALCRPRRRVIALDGDGAVLMRMGALAVVGHERPENLVHVLLDNGVHESTGAQSTVSSSTDFAAIAAASGYNRVLRTDDAQGLRAALKDHGRGPVFIHARMAPGVPEGLPRPTMTPEAVAARFRAHLL